jgi:hypothetical protein
MDRVQNPSNSECYTPKSETFRIYLSIILSRYKQEDSGNCFGTAVINSSFDIAKAVHNRWGLHNFQFLRGFRLTHIYKNKNTSCE